MPVTQKDPALTQKFSARVQSFLDGFKSDWEDIGKIAAEEIVRTTLAGIADKDGSFKAYSPGYQAIVDSVGGKPNGGVDLRGLFWHGKSKVRRFKDAGREARRQRNALARGGGRRGIVEVNIGGQTFTARTKETRPRLGIYDPNSELSADLIKVTVTPSGFTLRYQPREKDYMVRHNEDRPWFSIKKAAVTAAIRQGLILAFKARVLEFNRQ